jgi:hypothetical protein
VKEGCHAGFSLAFFDYAAGGQCELYSFYQSGDLSLMAITEAGAASVSSLRALFRRGFR